uniref:Uncharacterized protein n=1 Tax=Lepeophtheirus salmonis TaxID=72036 RepID=A0A0K2UME4_LEPSM
MPCCSLLYVQILKMELCLFNSSFSLLQDPLPNPRRKKLRKMKFVRQMDKNASFLLYTRMWSIDPVSKNGPILDHGAQLK